MAIDSIGIHVKLVGVDTGRQDQEVETIERVADLREDRLDLAQVADIAASPLDVWLALVGRFDLGDGLRTLILLAVDHDHLASCMGESPTDFVADPAGPAYDDGTTASEILRLDFLRSYEVAES